MSDLPSPRAFLTDLIDSLLPALPQSSAGATNVSAPKISTATNPLNSVPEAAKKQFLTLHVLFPNEFLPALDLLDRHLVTRFRIRRKQAQEDDASPHSGRDVVHSTSAATLVNERRDVGQEARMADVEAQHEMSALNAINITAAAPKDSADVEMLDAGLTTPHTVGNQEDLTHLLQTTKPQSRMRSKDEAGALEEQEQEQRDPENLDTVYYVRSAQQRSSRYSASYDSTTSYEVRLNAWNCSCPAFAFASYPSVHPEPHVPTFDSDALMLGIVGSDAIEVRAKEGTTFGGVSLDDRMPPVCKHLLACILLETCGLFSGFIEERIVSVEEATGWAAGWGD